MKKAMVFGGAGFVGSHVADYLSDAGFQTTVFDLYPSRWLRNDQQMVVGDILDVHSVDSALEGFDVVYNFAGLADLNAALDEPRKTLEVNVLGNINVMEACRKHGISRFVYASTVYVYSREGGFYRCSKRASEAYVEEYHLTYGIDYTILRFGSLYGPRADEANGMLRIVKAALETGKLRYQGHPDAAREYIHVEDAARASVVALGDEFRNESVVLTGQEPMKVIELLKMLGEILGLPEEAIEFSSGDNVGHYIRTPYAYQPKLGRKYIPPIHVDLGQGMLQLIESLQTNAGSKS